MAKSAGGSMNGAKLPKATWDYVIATARPVVYQETWWTVREAQDTGESIYLTIVSMSDPLNTQVVRRGHVELVSMSSWQEFKDGATSGKNSPPSKELPSPDDPKNAPSGPPYQRYSSFPIGDEMSYRRRIGRGVTNASGGWLGVVITSGRRYMTVMLSDGKVISRADPSKWYRVSQETLDKGWPQRFLKGQRDPLLGVIVIWRGHWHFVKDIRDGGKTVNLVRLSGLNTGSDQWTRNVPWADCTPISQYTLNTSDGQVNP